MVVREMELKEARLRAAARLQEEEEAKTSAAAASAAVVLADKENRAAAATADAVLPSDLFVIRESLAEVEARRREAEVQCSLCMSL